MKTESKTIAIKRSNARKWMTLLLASLAAGAFCLIGFAPSRAMADTASDSSTSVTKSDDSDSNDDGAQPDDSDSSAVTSPDDSDSGSWTIDSDDADSSDEATINPDDYVHDDSKVLKDNTKIMIAGLNVKYSELGGIKLVFATKPGDLPKGKSISAYKTELFNQLSDDDTQNGKEIMILLMPDAGKYALKTGSDIKGDLRDALLNTNYIGENSTAHNQLRKGQWDAAARTMTILTDQRISDSFSGNTSTKKDEKSSDADKSASKSKAKSKTKDKTKSKAKTKSAEKSNFFSIRE